MTPGAGFREGAGLSLWADSLCRPPACYRPCALVSCDATILRGLPRACVTSGGRKMRKGIDSDLTLNTPLYRYVSLESFISCLETKQLVLTNANLWEDTWEMFLDRVPREDIDGKRCFPSYSIHEDIYGQCWSRARESDAMWRIYSPSKTGVQIATSVEKFTSIDGIDGCYLGSVIYFESIPDLREKLTLFERHPLEFALYKRMAFSHECEVRLLMCGQSLPRRQTHVTLPFEPSTFIEGVTLDPRAEDWYIDAVARYCERVGLAVMPVKSNLYEPDAYHKIGLTIRWVPVEKEDA